MQFDKLYLKFVAQNVENQKHEKQEYVYLITNHYQYNEQ